MLRGRRRSRLAWFAPVVFSAWCFLVAACSPHMPEGMLDDEIFAAPSGTYCLKALREDEFRAAKEFPGVTTGSVVSQEKAQYYCFCKWSVVRRTSRRVSIRENITSYTLRTQSDSLSLRKMILQAGGGPLPKEGVIQNWDLWKDVVFRTDFDRQRNIVRRRLEKRPESFPTEFVPTLGEIVVDPSSPQLFNGQEVRSPFRPGGVGPFGQIPFDLIILSAPHLLNPVIPIEWPDHPVHPGETWLTSGRTLFRYVTLEEKEGNKRAHFSWKRATHYSREASVDLVLEMLLNQNQVIEADSTASGTVVLDPTHHRILNCRSAESSRARQKETRAGLHTDYVHVTTETLSIGWTHDDNQKADK